MFEIKVGILVSYDYKYLYHSLPLVYNEADKIFLAIDKDRLTWSGNSYSIDSSFFNWLKEIDTRKKILIYEDSFYLPELSTTDCDTRERNMLAEFMGSGGWHIQIDSDEYFLDFPGFVKFLRSVEKSALQGPVYVYTLFLTLFKELSEGYLYIQNSFENIPIATNYPKYNYIRMVKEARPISTRFLVVHQSWARSPEEIVFKLKSWGHSDEFNVTSYYNLWKSIDAKNYKYIRNFHPLTPTKWEQLELIKDADINKLLDFIRLSVIIPKHGSNRFKILLLRFLNKCIKQLKK